MRAHADGAPVRNSVLGPRGGRFFVSELQRARLLDAMFAVVAEVGYRGMAVRAVTERAGISTKTFYDLFADREDGFLAAFDYGIERLAECARPAYEHERDRDWAAGVRAGLGALLGFLDGEPALCKLVFVEALGAGPRVLERRADVSQALAGVIDGGLAGAKDGERLPPLLGESLVGAAFAVVHARLLSPDGGPLVGTLNDLVATIVLPYRGAAAAGRELRGTGTGTGTGTDTFSSGRESAAGVKSAARLAEGPTVGGLRPLGSGPVMDFRLTVRTQLVLEVVAEHPGSSNQRVSELAGIADQGQISRLMMRLAEQGLVKNARGGGQGTPKAWHLTPEGAAVITGAVARLTARSPHQAQASVPEGGEFRLTALTYDVLAAIDRLAGQRPGPGPSNRELADAVARHPAQMPKLLARLEARGLAVNLGGQAKGVPNAWRLTEQGEEIVALAPGRGRRRGR
jgi:AcrR family transcriptional regulator/DNA-binding MarR family transcriptional regulator